MRCPRCSEEGLDPYSACAKCGFTGPPGQVEELAHVAYLLGELSTWSEIIPSARERLRQRYLRRREEIETDLRLRQPALAEEETRKLRWEQACLAELQEEVAYWLERGWLAPGPAGALRDQVRARVEAVERRLSSAPAVSPAAFTSPQDRLRIIDYLQETLQRAHARGDLTSPEAYQAALAELQADRDEILIEAGLRARPAAAADLPAAHPAASEPPAAAGTRGAPAAPARARPPREPLTWERVWQTLLSERTLNVILFLGAFLLVASATTYVVANWEKLHPGIQLAFIVLVTLSFYAAGWFMRVRMNLRASSIAVTAVGSLLVPLDFYAVFIAGAFWPAERWPWVWLMASAFCLPAYVFTALRLRARFFGYLVAVAAGSLLCATLQVLGLHSAWQLVALAALALLLTVLAARYRDRFLAEPLRFVALLTTAVILPLGVGWWQVAGVNRLEFDVSLAGSWLLGAMLFAYAAREERSRRLGQAAAAALPVALLLSMRLALVPLEVERPWYALAWAVLGPLYLLAGRRLHLSGAGDAAPERGADGGKAGTEAAEPPAGAEATAVATQVGDLVLRSWARTAVGWGLTLMAVAAAWAALDLWAGAVTHAALAVGAALAIRAWDRPRLTFLVSLLTLSAITLGMSAGHMEPAELALGWALLALLHLAAGVRLRGAARYAAPVFGAVFPLAALAVLAPLALSDEPLLTYAVGHWLALAAWAWLLDRSAEHAGLEAVLGHCGPLRRSVLHWAMALPLPFFAALIYTRLRPPDAWLGLLLALVAWACLGLGQLPRLLARRPAAELSLAARDGALAWHTVALACSLAGPSVSFYYYDQPLLAVTLLIGAGLYVALAWALRRGEWLLPGGLALPAGLVLLLEYWQAGRAEQGVILAAVAGAYLLGSLRLERRHGQPRTFTGYLHPVGHVVAAAAVAWGLVPAVDGGSWSDAAKLWAAAGELLLAAVYALYAWFGGQERWAHVAIWLGVLAGGLVAVAYGQGRGSSAFKVALLAVLYVGLERGLAALAARARPAWAGRAWLLYRRPLLIAGWTVSAAAIGLALVRNLVMLGGGRTREVWAIVGLSTIVALYAASARLYRRRLFLWLAGGLAFLPWTLLSAWGWFVWAAPPPLRRYALAWAVLALIELIVGLALTPSLRSRRVTRGEFGLPLRAWANIWLALALVWGLPDTGTSSATWGLGIAFYLVSAVADHRRGPVGPRAARFLYPAVALLPVWAVYLLGYSLPQAPYELYGLLLLAVALPLLAVGRRLRPDDGLPLYLGAYGVAIAGTLLVASSRPLAVVALTFDLLLCVLSLRLFREPMWAYPAAAIAPAALLLALAESAVPPERRGWALIGLGTLYLAQAWLLRHVKRPELAVPLLAASFAVVALGLLPSSVDDVGAFWGYLAAALIYAVAAFWLRQPLLLTPALALLAVPYGVAIANLPLTRLDHGLAVFPGVAAALALAHGLDARLGRQQPVFPALDPRTWQLAPLLDWWGLPAYVWAYLGALAAVWLSWADAWRLAIALALAALTFLHATWRFRRRAWLLVAGALAQAAVLAGLDAAGWLRQPGWAALGFLPVTVLTAALAMAIERRRAEGPPLSARWWAGWSRPLYLLLALDLAGGQAAALWGAEPGAAVTLAHAVLLAVLATAWADAWLPFAAAGLGIVGMMQLLAGWRVVPTSYPIGLALLALAYGLAGYGLRALAAYAGRSGTAGRRAAAWVRPLEWLGLGLSALVLLALPVAGLDVIDLVIDVVLGRSPAVADHVRELRMAMWVLALCGLLYLATAVSRRLRWLGYGAVALLLSAWALWWRFLVTMPEFQWYAVPAGLYLLAIGWLEWRSGNRALAHWIDRAGLLVWLGSSWWQSLPNVTAQAWPYALVMGAEALLLVWWGSARRQKQFLYAGMIGVLLDAVTQSIEPLLTVNRWIVFGIAGLLLVGIAVLVERRLDQIRRLSGELRARLEAWE